MGDKKNNVVDMPINPNRIPNNIKMPEQLTNDELKQEVTRLRSILKQADARIQELANGWGLRRLEFLMEIIKVGGFGADAEATARAIILEDLGVTQASKDEESKG